MALHRVPGAESQSRRTAKGQIQPCHHAPAGTDKRGAPGLGAVRVFRFVPPLPGKGVPFWTPLCYGKLTAELHPKMIPKPHKSVHHIYPYPQYHPPFSRGVQREKSPKMTPKSYTKRRLSRYPDRSGRKEPPCRE